MTESAAGHDLSRFREAQDKVYPQALAELRRGRKETHWMWFVFPQVEGLGTSAMSQCYAIGSASEARAYLDDPVLGARLRECVEALLAVPDRTAREIMGPPDDVKLQSSLTLFADVADDPTLFERALARFFDGERDSRTMAFLAP